MITKCGKAMINEMKDSRWYEVAKYYDAYTGMIMIPADIFESNPVMVKEGMALLRFGKCFNDKGKVDACHNWCMEYVYGCDEDGNDMMYVCFREIESYC